MCVDLAVFGVLFLHLARVGLSWLGEEGGWSGSGRCRLSKSVDTGEKMEDIHIMAGDKDTKRQTSDTRACTFATTESILINLHPTSRPNFLKQRSVGSSVSFPVCWEGLVERKG